MLHKELDRPKRGDLLLFISKPRPSHPKPSLSKFNTCVCSLISLQIEFIQAKNLRWLKKGHHVVDPSFTFIQPRLLSFTCLHIRCLIGYLSFAFILIFYYRFSAFLESSDGQHHHSIIKPTVVLVGSLREKFCED